MCYCYVARVGEQAGHVTQNGVVKQNYNMKEKKGRQGCCVTFVNKDVPPACLYLYDSNGYCLTEYNLSRYFVVFFFGKVGPSFDSS